MVICHSYVNLQEGNDDIRRLELLEDIIIIHWHHMICI